jgi:hypothetical protein
MDLVQITLIIVSTYFILSMLIKGSLMVMYGYVLHQYFIKEDAKLDIEEDYDFDEIPF